MWHIYSNILPKNKNLALIFSTISNPDVGYARDSLVPWTKVTCSIEHKNVVTFVALDKHIQLILVNM